MLTFRSVCYCTDPSSGRTPIYGACSYQLSIPVLPSVAYSDQELKKSHSLDESKTNCCTGIDTDIAKPQLSSFSAIAALYIMSSPLENLPPELSTQICEIIYNSQDHNRQHHTTFLALSLVSKRVRSYSTPYMFRNLFLKESCLGTSATGSFAHCISTLHRLNILDHVKSVTVAVPMSSGRCEWEYERDSIVQSLDKFSKLTHLYIRTAEVLSKELVDEVQQILIRCCYCSRATPLKQYWWWYSAKKSGEVQIPRDRNSMLMSGCRMGKLFGCNRRRIQSSDLDVQHRYIARHISASDHLTYLFLLN
jgi:hypothetical protein